MSMVNILEGTMFCMWSHCFFGPLLSLPVRHTYEALRISSTRFPPDARHDLFVTVTQCLSQSAVKYDDVNRQNVARLITHS